MSGGGLRLALLFTVLLATLLLSGCIKLDAALKVSSDNTVSGTVTFAWNKGLPSGVLSEVASSSPLPSTVKGITSVPYEDDKYIGTDYMLTDVPLSEFNSSAFVENSMFPTPKIERKGAQFVISWPMDLSTGPPPTGNPQAEQNYQEASKSAEVKISITFPGRVISSNGQVSGNTVTWEPKWGQETTLQATAEATAGRSMTLTLIVAAAALVIVGIGAAVLVMSKRKAKGAGEAPA